MGSQQFQTEYIEYLQERNNELLNKLSQMKENYESKILSKNLNKHYLTTVVEEILSVCTTLPQEIDIFFEKMTAAMNALKSILIKKSEMVYLVDKISNSINADGSVNEHSSEATASKKSGTVKVSPMINGHVISTEPRIYLNRVSKNEFCPINNLEREQLSPILETSSISDVSMTDSYYLKEAMISIERVELTKLKETQNSDSRSSSSKRKSSLSNVKRTRSSDAPDDNKQTEVSEPHFHSSCDPLEGPSWLYNENHSSTSKSANASNSFVNTRRRRQRFAHVFDKKREMCWVESDEDEEPYLLKNESQNEKKKISVGSGKDSTNSKNASVSLCHSSECIEETPQKPKVLDIKFTNEILRNQPIIPLYDCMADEGLKDISLKSNTSSEGSVKGEMTSENSTLSTCSLQRRQKRKAAPINLKEPNLTTKLRRN